VSYSCLCLTIVPFRCSVYKQVRLRIFLLSNCSDRIREFSIGCGVLSFGLKSKIQSPLPLAVSEGRRNRGGRPHESLLVGARHGFRPHKISVIYISYEHKNPILITVQNDSRTYRLTDILKLLIRCKYIFSLFSHPQIFPNIIINKINLMYLCNISNTFLRLRTTSKPLA
jgi:hypothetical protein